MAKSKPTIECPDCKGAGQVSRPPVVDAEGIERAYAGRHFPMLCDRCGGSGRAPAPPPGPQG
jgi:DnaJ-class molecular chaperone